MAPFSGKNTSAKPEAALPRRPLKPRFASYRFQHRRCGFNAAVNCGDGDGATRFHSVGSVNRVQPSVASQHRDAQRFNHSRHRRPEWRRSNQDTDRNDRGYIERPNVQRLRQRRRRSHSSTTRRRLARRTGIRPPGNLNNAARRQRKPATICHRNQTKTKARQP